MGVGFFAKVVNFFQHMAKSNDEIEYTINMTDEKMPRVRVSFNPSQPKK
jgi:hypothetical protein